VRRHAARQPHAIAVLCDGEEWSYARLDAESDRLAHRLAALGAGPETLVALAVQRSVRMLAALLAILKTGAAYLPIDLAYPEQRKAFVLEDAAPVLVITTHEGAAKLPADSDIPRLFLDDPDEQGPDDVTAAALSVPVAPSQAAYTIYTSGSTGEPKGVVISRAAMARLLGWAVGRFGGDGLAEVLAATSLSFDVSVFELFSPLVAGGRVEIVRDLLALADRPHRGSLVSAVPSALGALLGGAGSAPVLSADHVVLAGEALTADAVAQIRGAVPGGRIANIYGPTEATVYATAWYADEDGAQVTIGRPLPGTRAYILDASLAPVPAGVTGELYLSGGGVAR
jgi:pristinamycin I synthase-3/4